MLIDSHAHIYSEYYADIASVINLSSEHGIKYIINAGVDHNSNKEILALTEKFPSLYVTLGIHPEYADCFKQSDLNFIEDNLLNKKVLAIGEIGLDYHYDSYNKENQIKLFELQLKLAEKYHLPVVIHSRQATNDTITILKKYHLNGVIHSFSGSIETAKEYIKMGYKLGINGVVTFKNANIKEVIKSLGIKHFVLETDSPYLTPVPNRGKQNYPGNISDIVDFLAEYLEITKEEITNITTSNIQSIFDRFEL